MSHCKNLADAIQFIGNNCIEVLNFIGSPSVDNLMIHTTDNPVIRTSRGDVTAKPGDWIIRRIWSSLPHDNLYEVVAAVPIQEVAKPIETNLTMARINYTNHRGARRFRRIIPIRIERGPNEYHPTKCALLVAWDMELTPPIEKTFALACIHSWEDLPDRA